MDVVFNIYFPSALMPYGANVDNSSGDYCTICGSAEGSQ
jgi:hypothetical protein